MISCPNLKTLLGTVARRYGLVISALPADVFSVYLPGAWWLPGNFLVMVDAEGQLFPSYRVFFARRGTRAPQELVGTYERVEEAFEVMAARFRAEDAKARLGG